MISKNNSVRVSTSRISGDPYRIFNLLKKFYKLIFCLPRTEVLLRQNSLLMLFFCIQFIDSINEISAYDITELVMHRFKSLTEFIFFSFGQFSNLCNP